MKLFIANIARECSEDELRSLFEEHGEVKSLKIIKDKETGQSRGFGFIEMATEDAGNKAMKELHDKEIHGRALVVNEAKEQQRRPSSRGGRGGGMRL